MRTTKVGIIAAMTLTMGVMACARGGEQDKEILGIVLKWTVVETGPDGKEVILAQKIIDTLNNQSARVFAGKYLPIIDCPLAAQGFGPSSVIGWVPVGPEMLVTPSIGANGKIFIHLTPPEWSSSRPPSNGSYGGMMAQLPPRDDSRDPRVVARDGETVATDRLIAWEEQLNDHSIPWLSDLPVVGEVFRWQTQSKEKHEIRVILTPRIARNKAEVDRILAEQAKHEGK